MLELGAGVEDIQNSMQFHMLCFFIEFVMYKIRERRTADLKRENRGDATMGFRHVLSYCALLTPRPVAQLSASSCSTLHTYRQNKNSHSPYSRREKRQIHK